MKGLSWNSPDYWVIIYIASLPPQCVQRALDSLVAEGKVKEKQYGKQKVYMVDQSLFPVVSEAELKKMDKEMVEQQEKQAAAQKLCQQLESRDCGH